MVISSEDERTTPTKPDEKSLSAANLDDTPRETEVMPPTPTDREVETPTRPEKDTAEMAKGLNLESKAVGDNIPTEKESITTLETEPTNTREPATSTVKKPDDDTEEERYLQERKRKGKAPVKAKQDSKKPCTTNTGIVIRDPERRDPQRRREACDDEYTSSEEPDSESDVSLEDEEFQEQQLPENHRELIHPLVERLEYLPWQVDLNDDLTKDIKHYNTKKLQDVFDDKDDSKQRQANLERAVAELAAENREARAELACLEDVREIILKEMARNRMSSEAGTSGLASGRNDPSESAEKEEEDEEFEDDGTEQPEDLPEEAPAPNSTPRRSRRNK
ncbi:glutamic acid-rich protein-like [Salvia splendens]|uniref:glutamic acid-rich protein-like n=1 Tax=Salvia splendens TaxID=180675 RepID=UPI001C2773DD|nr:glutamic acid-rich protein-like [Salvia splendens]